MVSERVRRKARERLGVDADTAPGERSRRSPDLLRTSTRRRVATVCDRQS